MYFIGVIFLILSFFSLAYIIKDFPNPIKFIIAAILAIGAVFISVIFPDFYNSIGNIISVICGFLIIFALLVGLGRVIINPLFWAEYFREVRRDLKSDLRKCTFILILFNLAAYESSLFGANNHMTTVVTFSLTYFVCLIDTLFAKVLTFQNNNG